MAYSKLKNAGNNSRKSGNKMGKKREGGDLASLHCLFKTKFIIKA